VKNFILKPYSYELSDDRQAEGWNALQKRLKDQKFVRMVWHNRSRKKYQEGIYSLKSYDNYRISKNGKDFYFDWVQFKNRTGGELWIRGYYLILPEGVDPVRPDPNNNLTGQEGQVARATKWLFDNPGVTIQEAASKFGVHAGSIRNDASQRGVSLVRSGRMGKTARAVEMMMNNKTMTINEATRECCVTSSSIYTFARERGLDLTRARESVGNEDLAVDWLLSTPNSTIQQAADKFHLKESVVRYHCQRLGVRLFTTSIWVKSRHD